jgi:hypothetical protein
VNSVCSVVSFFRSSKAAAAVMPRRRDDYTKISMPDT